MRRTDEQKAIDSAGQSLPAPRRKSNKLPYPGIFTGDFAGQTRCFGPLLKLVRAVTIWRFPCSAIL